MKITIHQPEHIPWLGFFHKVNMADTYVILDNVQFRNRYFQNRNKIKTPEGWTWITVPVEAHKRDMALIKNISIGADQKWKKKWWNALFYSYKKAPYFNDYSSELEALINKDWTNLAELNVALIKFLCKHLKIETQYKSAADIGAEGKASDLILDICKKTNANTYISGISGKDYLKLDDFANNNIEVIFQEFHHPIYSQLFNQPFQPCMSAIDLLFNCGEEGLAIINGEGVPVMEEVFI